MMMLTCEPKIRLAGIDDLLVPLIDNIQSVPRTMKANQALTLARWNPCWGRVFLHRPPGQVKGPIQQASSGIY